MELIEPTKITPCESNLITWDEIELAESYLVCGMFEEAAEQSSSILKRIHDSEYSNAIDEIVDMMTSLAMVLVQSWKDSGRTSDLLSELQYYFGAVIEIPVQVILTGACVQVSSGHQSRAREFLEEYLAAWEFKNQKYFALSRPDEENTSSAAPPLHSILEVNQYLKVVELYAVTLLGGILNDVDHAILWVEKAQLPEEARQDLLRRLLSLNAHNSSSSKQGDTSSPEAEENEAFPLSSKEVKQSNKPNMVFRTQGHSSIDSVRSSMWDRLQNIMHRFCSSVVASKTRIVFGCLIFLACYYIRNKRETLKRAAQRRVLQLKQLLIDVWQLAFSYQVNPLAAVQPLPAPANRGR